MEPQYESEAARNYRTRETWEAETQRVLTTTIRPVLERFVEDAARLNARAEIRDGTGLPTGKFLTLVFQEPGCIEGELRIRSEGDGFAIEKVFDGAVLGGRKKSLSPLNRHEVAQWVMEFGQMARKQKSAV